MSPVALATLFAVLSRIEFVLRLLALIATDRSTWTMIVVAFLVMPITLVVLIMLLVNGFMSDATAVVV